MPNKISAKHTHVIAVTNQKGGCGKTTTTLNLGASLASRGKRVLLIDLDPQCSLTIGLAGKTGVLPGSFEGDLFNVLLDFGPDDTVKNLSLDKVVVESGFRNLHLAPGSYDLCEFSLTMASRLGRENRLKKALAKVVEAKIYDFILIDTPPSLGLLSVNAFMAASKTLVTTLAEPFSVDGMGLLFKTLQSVREEINPGLEILGLLFTRIDLRRRIAQQIMTEALSCSQFAGHFQSALQPLFFKGFVRESNILIESSKHRVPVLSFEPRGKAAQDYLQIAREVEKRCAAVKARVAASENQKIDAEKSAAERIRVLLEANRKARDRAMLVQSESLPKEF